MLRFMKSGITQVNANGLHYVSDTLFSTLNGDSIIPIQLSQYNGCWCPGSLRRQDISAQDIDYVE